MRLRPTKMLVPFADHLGVKLSSRVKSLIAANLTPRLP